jgi:hypothetical protein
VIDLDRLALLGRSGNDTELIGAAASLSIFSSATRNWLRALAVGFDVTNVTSHVLQSIDQKSSPSF